MEEIEAYLEGYTDTQKEIEKVSGTMSDTEFIKFLEDKLDAALDLVERLKDGA